MSACTVDCTVGGGIWEAAAPSTRLEVRPLGLHTYGA